MKKDYQHQAFLTTNRIEIDDLPKGLKQKIGLFSTIQEKTKNLSQQDASPVDLKAFDHEIYLDLLDHFDEKLANNEMINEDEDILDALWRTLNTIDLPLSFLKRIGIKAIIPAQGLQIGKYKLVRTKTYTYKYNLVLDMQ